jgi:tRNA threonylcarbamoyladenosine biosynthesis protein TsaE
MESKSARQTQKIAADLIKKIPKNRKHAFVIALEGDLGGGKTTFAQGLARALGIKEKILSPTFNIFKIYKLRTKNYKLFYHFDCYRIEKAKEILYLGFKEIIKDPQNIVAIEWADRIKKIIPQNAVWLNFSFVDKTTREINFLR